MSKIVLSAELRTDSGKGASRRLRRDDLVPAIVYGANQEPVQITLAGKAVRKASEQSEFYSQPVAIELNGASEDVIVKDLQRNSVKENITHIDFQRLDANAALVVSVPLSFVNADKSAGIKLGGALAKYSTSVKVRCLPANLPKAIEVDLASLVVGDTVLLSSLTLPEGVESVELMRGHDQGIAGVLATRSSRQAD